MPSDRRRTRARQPCARAIIHTGVEDEVDFCRHAAKVLVTISRRRQVDFLSTSRGQCGPAITAENSWRRLWFKDTLYVTAARQAWP